MLSFYSWFSFTLISNSDSVFRVDAPSLMSVLFLEYISVGVIVANFGY